MLESAGNPLAIRDYTQQPWVFSMENLKDFNTVYNFLLSGQPLKHPFRDMCKKANIELPEYFKTLIVDGSTQVQHFVFDVVVPGSDVPPGDVPAPYEIQHFGRVLNTISNWAEKMIRTLDMHVILTALEDEHNEKSGATKIRPLIWGQSRGEICSYAYLVMRLCPYKTMDTLAKSIIAADLEEAKKSQIVGIVRPTNSIYAKDQYGMRDEKGELMAYMYDPTISKIWDAILAVGEKA
jgi:hypothetical protein